MENKTELEDDKTWWSRRMKEINDIRLKGLPIDKLEKILQEDFKKRLIIRKDIYQKDNYILLKSGLESHTNELKQKLQYIKSEYDRLVMVKYNIEHSFRNNNEVNEVFINDVDSIVENASKIVDYLKKDHKYFKSELDTNNKYIIKDNVYLQSLFAIILKDEVDMNNYIIKITS